MVFKDPTFRATFSMVSHSFLLLLASRKPLNWTGSKLMSKSAMFVLPKSCIVWHEVATPFFGRFTPSRFLTNLPSFLSPRNRVIAGPESKATGAKQGQPAKARDTRQGQEAGPGGSGLESKKKDKGLEGKAQAATATDLRACEQKHRD
jgi:hypothetical protein